MYFLHSLPCGRPPVVHLVIHLATTTAHAAISGVCRRFICPKVPGALQQQPFNHRGIEQQALTSFQVRYAARFGFAAQPLLRHAQAGSHCTKRDQLRSGFHAHIIADRPIEVYSACTARIQRIVGYFTGRLLTGMKYPILGLCAMP